MQRRRSGKALPKGEAGRTFVVHAWKWINEASGAATDPTAQPRQGLQIPAGDRGAEGYFTVSAHPQSNDTGEVIEREP